MTICNTCPFCKQELEMSLNNAWAHGGIEKRELSLRCISKDCSSHNPQKIMPWILDFMEHSSQITYYQACISHNNKHYILQAGLGFTKLYYNVPNAGALVQSPLVHLSYMLKLQDPYEDYLKQHLQKLVTYLVFS